MIRAGSTWTEERIQLFARLWDQGYTASQIANELGQGLSRSAVIGKAHRLDFTGRARGGNTKPREKKAKPPRPAKPSRPDGISKPPIEPVPDIDDMQIPVEQRCSLLELDSTKCRWPVGQPGEESFFFCGGAPVAGSSYCRGHTIRSINPRGTREP